MNLKLGYFIPPIILAAFIACAVMFGGTMYNNYRVEGLLSEKDNKFICVSNTYDVQRDADKRYFVTFKDGKKFYFHNFSALTKASMLLLVVDRYNRVNWTTISNQKAANIHRVYNVTPGTCVDRINR